MGIEVYVYIIIMALVTFAVRVLPMMLIKKEITNVFVRSFLYYVPYVTLAVMTFPAIIESTVYPIAGFLALIVGLIITWFGANLFQVALLCCGTVFLCELLVNYF